MPSKMTHLAKQIHLQLEQHYHPTKVIFHSEHGCFECGSMENEKYMEFRIWDGDKHFDDYDGKESRDDREFDHEVKERAGSSGYHVLIDHVRIGHQYKEAHDAEN